MMTSQSRASGCTALKRVGGGNGGGGDGARESRTRAFPILKDWLPQRMRVG